jgi:hypothetical protein
MNPSHHYRVRATGELLGQFKEARINVGYGGYSREGTSFLFIRVLQPGEPDWKRYVFRTYDAEYDLTHPPLPDDIESVEDAAFARRKHALAGRMQHSNAN